MKSGSYTYDYILITGSANGDVSVMCPRKHPSHCTESEVISPQNLSIIFLFPLSCLMTCHHLQLFSTQQARWQMRLCCKNEELWSVSLSGWPQTHSWWTEALMSSFVGMFLKGGEFKNLWRVQIYFWPAACFGQFWRRNSWPRAYASIIFWLWSRAHTLISLVTPGVFLKLKSTDLFSQQEKNSEYTSIRKYDWVLTGGILFNQ